ncbi:MAG TPA: DinB family protein [Nevskiaceae bacterium]|nr:DinB family protein [Nevskiaceae bacterium]
MDMKKHVELMCGWHVWAIERFFACVDAASDADYRRDSGLYFKSIHGSVNHMLLVERLWRGRLTGNVIVFDGLDYEIEQDRAKLKSLVLESAKMWRPYVQSLSDAEFHGLLQYKNMAGQAMSLPRIALVHTMFTHGAHHRGQVTTVLTQMGLKTPELDYPYFLAALPRETFN